MVVFSVSAINPSANTAANIDMLNSVPKSNTVANIDFYSNVTAPVNSCSGASNCVITCGTNITGGATMNSYNISFSGSGTTYLGGNLVNFTLMNVGSCNVKLNNYNIGR